MNQQTTRSKFTQQEISAARRVYNAWIEGRKANQFFTDFLSAETRKGFRDSVDNHDVAPFKIVKS